MKKRLHLYQTLALIAVLIGLLPANVGGAPKAGGDATVIWVSIDGFRYDYLDRARPPALSRIAAEGAVTRELVPVFPSLTFPNHIAQATGTTVDRHGIPGNIFYDRSAGIEYNHPDDSALLRAEPIWVTAKRQGVRVVNTDWPVSQKPSGQWRVDYSPADFDKKRTDEARLDETIRVLKNDRGEEPIRLVMTYIGQVDLAGHRFGPESNEVNSAVLEVDALVDRFQAEIVRWFDATHRPEDELYLLITTDHGMETLHTQVSLERLLGRELLQDVRMIRGGTMAMLYLDALPEAQRAGRAGAIVEKLKNSGYIKAWPEVQVPQQLHFSDSSRIGDVVITLQPGYIFATQKYATTAPVIASPRGAHGYNPADSEHLRGMAMLWRYRKPISTKNLGRIENTQWYALVCKILAIEPAPQTIDMSELMRKALE